MRVRLPIRLTKFPTYCICWMYMCCMNVACVVHIRTLQIYTHSWLDLSWLGLFDDPKKYGMGVTNNRLHCCQHDLLKKKNNKQTILLALQVFWNLFNKDLIYFCLSRKYNWVLFVVFPSIFLVFCFIWRMCDFYKHLLQAICGFKKTHV